MNANATEPQSHRFATLKDAHAAGYRDPREVVGRHFVSVDRSGGAARGYTYSLHRRIWTYPDGPSLSDNYDPEEIGRTVTVWLENDLNKVHQPGCFAVLYPPAVVAAAEAIRAALPPPPPRPPNHAARRAARRAGEPAPDTVYTVIVKDGEIIDRDLHRIAPAIIRSCGHNHRTREAAERCKDHLHNRRREVTGSWMESAAWYNALIHEHRGDSMNYLPPDDADLDEPEGD